MKKEVYIKSLRRFRVYHRYISLTLLVFLLVVSVTGILLAWKKNIDVLQPPTQKGSKDFEAWMPMHEIATIAEQALVAAHPKEEGNGIDKMDARPSKGVVKVIFDNHSWEVQVDAVNGEVKSIARRHSDWIERLHDGSIINDLFKLISMNFVGLGVIFLCITGYWMWYAPKRVRFLKRRRH